MAEQRRDQQLGRRGLSRRGVVAGGAALAGGLTVGAPRMTMGASAVAGDPQPMIRAKTIAFMRATGAPGIAVCYHAGGAENILCFGLADIARRQPVTADTVFELGSVTKTFTATLLATQIKSVDPTYPYPKQLDDPVTRYLPPDVAGTSLQHVTLRELATHTSGFPRSGGGQAANNLFADQPPSPELVWFWQHWVPAAGTPIGTHWDYSNVGFVTLGFAAGGQPVPPLRYLYDDLLAERVTGPLGLTATTANPAAGAALAQGYVADRGQIAPAKSRAADIKSTPRDVLTWLKAQLGLLDAHIPAALARAIALTHAIAFNGGTNAPQPLRYDMGLAWQIYDKQAGVPPILNKNGATGRGGFSCFLGFVPARQVAVAALTNLDVPDGDALEGTDNGSVDRLASDILRTLIGAPPATPTA